MPQGGRKKPFSGKAKKEQLQNKRAARQQQGPSTSGAYSDVRNSKSSKSGSGDNEGASPVVNLGAAGKAESLRYALRFFRESNEEIRARKELACKELEPVPETELDVDGALDFFPNDLQLPKRPPWSYQASRDVLEGREQKYFNEYVAAIQEKYTWRDIGFFELNLETWRQLWRVLEMSDIVLMIVDIRFPAHMFPPSLYEYVVHTLKKDFILVLNKIDLAPSQLVCAWRNYFLVKYPRMRIAMFTTLPTYNLVGARENRAGLLMRKRRGKFRLAAEGSQQLYEICRDLVSDEIDISSWWTKIQEEQNVESDYGEDDDETVEIGTSEVLKTVDTSFFEHERFRNQVLTIGCLGQPNVGKSSLINALMGCKVVSVSRTPGHTKHFQTIFLTNHVRLCDCPGLVFPSTVPKMIQVLMGCYPIAQLREPFTTVMYLAERMDLPRMLRIEHPDSDETWCAMDVCDGWAKKRGFYTARAARLDTYRAANDLLRMALEGRICICLRPPGYSSNKEIWMNHPDNEKVKWIQALNVVNSLQSQTCIPRETVESSEEEEEISFNTLHANKFAVLQEESD